jgi:hypothetical protein
LCGCRPAITQDVVDEVVDIGPAIEVLAAAWCWRQYLHNLSVLLHGKQ